MQKVLHQLPSHFDSRRELKRGRLVPRQAHESRKLRQELANEVEDDLASVSRSRELIFLKKRGNGTR
jgi:signal recognition particle subunit SEC65